MPDLSKTLPSLNRDLIDEIKASSASKALPENTELIRDGQYVKVIPLVLEGLIKVFASHEANDLLLYYIRPGESCIMSFTAGLNNEPSRISAVTEEATTALLLPIDKVLQWTRRYPDINTLFFRQYHQRYTELLDNLNRVLFDRMDKRLYDYLKEKIRLRNTNPLKLSHRQIAEELGTAREVISRTMKKLEAEARVKQHANSIELL